jgi:hypothetical protein
MGSDTQPTPLCSYQWLRFGTVLVSIHASNERATSKALRRVQTIRTSGTSWMNLLR